MAIKANLFSSKSFLKIFANAKMFLLNLRAPEKKFYKPITFFQAD